MTVSKLILSKIKQAVIRFLAALGLVLVLAICQNLANL